MKRDYASGVSTNADMFVGIEIEQTPAKNMKTLFVVGIKPVDRIWEICNDRKIKHVYLGANHCFNLDQREEYEKLANSLLEMGYWVTLDLDVRYYDGALYMLEELSKHDRFILQISVKLPCLTKLNYHATLKIDDKDFRASNPGVWVHQIHDLMDRDKFTDWSLYGKDEIITEQSEERDPILDAAPFMPLTNMQGIKNEQF